MALDCPGALWLVWRGSSEAVAKSPIHVRTGYQARPAPQVAQMNFLKLNPPIALLATSQGDLKLPCLLVMLLSPVAGLFSGGCLRDLARRRLPGWTPRQEYSPYVHK
jgi:hypothetical protein